MNNTLRRLLVGTPVVGAIYTSARRKYHHLRTSRAARRYFVNFNDYRSALSAKGLGTVDIVTTDGLTITIRQNGWDARILQEIFFEDPYTRSISLAARPTVVDIGGYIGDFSLYAAKRLNARKVVVCEPSKKNFAILRRNVERNRYEGTIVPLNVAVSNADSLLMNVDLPDNQQVNVSSYSGGGPGLERIPCISLEKLIDAHQLEYIDLLKIDCEGGEYDILLNATDRLFARIGNIVFEYHEIDGYRDQLNRVLDRLKMHGYRLQTQGGGIIAATRSH